MQGESASGTGVFGFAHGTGAAGVTGDSTASNGIGVRAMASGSGTAFKASGRVAFSTSGLATVALGAKVKTVTPGTDLVADSRILCTLESNQAGLSIERVTKNITADTFKVVLSATVASGKTAKVAWFVIG